MTRYTAKFSGLLAFLAALAVVSCHPLDEGNGETPPPIGSIVGVWTITESNVVVTNPQCMPPVATYLLFIAQNGNTVVAQTGFDVTPPLSSTSGSDGSQFAGTLNGNTLGVQGANPLGMGTLQTARAASVAANCNSLSGVRTLSYTEGNFSCSGQLSFTGIRLVQSGCGGTLAATAVPESTSAHDTAGTAQAITRPTEVSGTIAGSQEDWYGFTLTENAFVTILLNGPLAPADVDLFLTDELGTTQLASSQSPSGREAVADNLLPGTYKVRVLGKALALPVSYTLLIQ